MCGVDLTLIHQLPKLLVNQPSRLDISSTRTAENGGGDHAQPEFNVGRHLAGDPGRLHRVAQGRPNLFRSAANLLRDGDAACRAAEERLADLNSCRSRYMLKYLALRYVQRVLPRAL